MGTLVELGSFRASRARKIGTDDSSNIGLVINLNPSNFVNKDSLFAYGTYSLEQIEEIDHRMKITRETWLENKSLWYQSFQDEVIDIAYASVNDKESTSLFTDLRNMGNRIIEMPSGWYPMDRCEHLYAEMICTPTTFYWRIRLKDNARELHTATFDLMDVGMILASLAQKGDG